MSNKKIKLLAKEITRAYKNFGVDINIAGGTIIPYLKRYIFNIELMPGTRIQGLFTYAQDIQVILKVHLFYPFRDKASIYIAVSEVDVDRNQLLKILRSPKFQNSTMQIPLALGYDILGNMYLADLAKLLHLIVVGPSGTGKSVALQCIVLSIIVKCTVSSVRLILFDIGANSLSHFSSVKHLYHPIIKDTETGIIVLESLVAEMDRRITLSEDALQNLPFIVCIIDEFDDTIAGIEGKEDSKRFTIFINSIIRRGRKAKIILILASHNPKSGNVKVNLDGIVPRITFQSANHYNSSTAIGISGAQSLRGGGAMLFKSQEVLTPMFLQGSFVTKDEIKKILSNAPAGCDDLNMLEVRYPELSEYISCGETTVAKSQKEFADILFWVLGRKKVSALEIKTTFRMGNRVNEIIEKLYEMSIITDKNANQPRKVIPQSIEEIPEKIMNLLQNNGYSIDMISEKISKR